MDFQNNLRIHSPGCSHAPVKCHTFCSEGRGALETYLFKRVIVEQFYKCLRTLQDGLLDLVKLRREKGINNGEKTIRPDRLFSREF